MSTHPKMQKLVAAVARTQGGKFVDLPQIESDVRITVCQRAIDEVWELFDAIETALGEGELSQDEGATFTELMERTLRLLESKLDEEVFRRLFFNSDRDRHTRLAAHRAARGVRKVRGAKS